MTVVARVEGLTLSFPRTGTPFRALNDVSLTVGTGEIVALVGESGSGKTVLGSCLLGLVPGGRHTTVTGTVEVDGVDMVAGPASRRRWVRRHRLGAVFQDPLTSLDPTMRVGPQVGARDSGRALDALAECGIPAPEQRIRYWPHQLSGGLRQRVSIAGAVTAAGGYPSLLVADEPTTALDVRVQDQIVRLFARLRDDHGTSILLITHDLGVAAQVADRVVVMSAGEVRESGRTGEVLRAPRDAYTRKLVSSRLDVAAPLPPASPPPGDPVLRLTGIVKDFRDPHRRRTVRRVLHGVDLTLGAGEAVALVGESGSGKSTLLRIAAGLETATAGAAEVPGGRPQLIFQDARSSLTPWLSISGQIAERLAAAGVPRGSRAGRVADLLARVGLDERVAGSKPRQLSGGQCQRAAIARALASAPRVLLCDEPVSALDATLATQVVELLDELRRTTGVALLLVTHDLAVAKRIAGRVAVMTEGRIVEEGPVARIFEAPEHDYTRQLLAASPSLA
ncbi:ABC transporter ATP-binding protein [Actinoplanes sp. RD1]|uniref:ABC transporter ATP-binding protein n=1 Tax=Actinoplanes sp. RD1 TaxID=3064538 RepID=UPI002740656B|nr:ABC transporter ATP-binding protein [Actinoplanes sp. RD1]